VNGWVWMAPRGVGGGVWGGSEMVVVRVWQRRAKEEEDDRALMASVGREGEALAAALALLRQHCDNPKVMGEVALCWSPTALSQSVMTPGVRGGGGVAAALLPQYCGPPRGPHVPAGQARQRHVQGGSSRPFIAYRGAGPGLDLGH
jgi:hypothetical protein